MTLQDILEALQAEPLRPFWSESDVARACRVQTPEVRQSLGALIRQGRLSMLGNDLYANPFSTYTVDALAGALLRPSYLSLEYALHFHNVLPQTPWTLTSITTAPCRVMVVNGWRYEYESVSPHCFGGYNWSHAPNTHVSIAMATPTKALLDWLYCRGVAGQWSDERIASMLDDMNLDEIAPDTLMADATTYFHSQDPHCFQRLLALASPVLAPKPF